MTSTPSTPATTPAGTVLLYVGGLVLAALTWVGAFLANVLIRFGDSGCNEVVPENAHHGQLSLAGVALLALAVWAFVWWLSGRRAGIAVLGVVATLPAVVFFVLGLDYQSWGNGWCF